MGFTKFKLLGERLLSGIGLNKTFFPIYDNQADADFRVSLNTLITFISNELGVSSKAVFELTGVSNTGNNYISTLDISSYKTEGLYIFKPSTDSDDVTTLNVNSVGTLDIKEFDGTSLVDKTDLKAVNTYLLLNKTTYWLVVGGVSGEHPNPTSYLAHATVDGVYGDDSYAELNNPKRPYLTITAAQDALKLAIITTISSPVQCKGFCYVKKGVYFDEYLINRQYVDMHFEYGAIVISDTDGKPVISDTDGNNEPVNINITGQGQFYHTRYNPQGLDNQAVALSNSDSKEFNFEAYEVDGIQIYGGNSITTKINVKNTRIRFTIFVGNKKSIHFEKCKFLSGLDLDSFFHDDNEITCNECEFIVPSDNLDSLVEIRDLSNTLIDTIDVSSGVQSGEPFQFGSGTRLELQNSHVGAHYHPIIAGIYLSNTYLDVHGNPSINSRYLVTNSKIRIQKDGGIGIFLSQTCEVNLSQPEHPNWIFRDIQIEDETQNKTTTALVAKKRDTLSTTIPYMFASIISNCEVTIGSGYEAGYVAIDTSYEFVPEGSTGLETFAQGLTIVSNAINLDCQNKAFPVFNVGSFGTSPLDITISNSYGVVEATLIIECSSFPSGLITLPIVSYPPTYQPSSGINRIVLKMNWLSGNYIWTITEQSTTDKQNIQLIKSSNFSAENDNNYTTIGTSTVTEPTGINGKGYSVIVISGTTTIDSIPYSTAGTKITRLYNGSIWLTKVEIASGGATNLGYTPSPTNGIVTSDTGTDATLTLVDGTDAGLVSPSMKSTWDNKQATLTDANFATFVNSTANKTTPVDADIVPIVDVSTGKRFSLSNLWTDYLKPKADAIYATISNLNLKMNLSMSARTIKLNKTASTANGIDGSVNDLMELMAGCTDNTGSGALLAISTTNTKAIRFTSGASILRSFAGGTDGAILVCQNSNSALMSVNHEDTAETTVANRIYTGGQNVQVGIGGVFVLQYKTSNSRWNLIGGNGLNYWSVFAGSSNRLVEVDANGLGSATKTILDAYISDATNISNLENISNWTGSTYTGPSISGETQGKEYYGTSYHFIMITNTVPKRFIYI